MEKTGIVRRIDSLGRVVIPKELRNTLNIGIGTPLEIYVDDCNILLRKYNPESLHQKVRDLKSILDGYIDEIGLDQCIAIEDELNKIDEILSKATD